MSIAYAFYADRLIHHPLYLPLHDALHPAIVRARSWSWRMSQTLSRHYRGLASGKVQVRHWNRALQFALFAAGWEVYARPIGTGPHARYQLCFAPASVTAGTPHPTDLYAAC